MTATPFILLEMGFVRSTSTTGAPERIPDAFAATPTPYAPETVFVNHLIRSRFNYQFSRALSVRLIIDYNGVLQNPALISLDRQKRITLDVSL